MRRLLVATAAAAFALPAFADASTSQPSLHFTKLIPPRVHGAHFKAGERIGVTLFAGKTRHVRFVHASGTGGFTVAFSTLTTQARCGGTISLLAVGAAGDKAVYKLPALACTTTGSSSTPTMTTTTGDPYIAPPPPYTR